MMIAERMRVPQGHHGVTSAGLHLRFPAGEASVRLALRQWRMALQTAEVCPDVMGRAEIVLAEVLNNITEHGCPDGIAGWIDLHCDLTEAGLQVIIADQGPPVPLHLLHPSPQPAASPCDLELLDLPEGGFGWSMIRALTRDLCLQRVPAGNRLSFLVPRGAAEN
jgi:serine/threonine-protein kinase RsbW